MLCHQRGLSEQQLAVHAWAIKINGVNIQWTKQRLELAIPMLSAEKFLLIAAIFTTQFCPVLLFV